ncbi:hypothetical protein VLI49_002617 [Enterobacter kobei]|uniref:hypothetical protein n=1 Tax=Enterobacter kobei TaxID=208224 RepID=UPI001F51C08B|nr:hypothetical protein [Enterobacter kobei]EMC7917057.1 hypothetical protein [Enterobacter kobei]MCH4289585.1 hypothetical protein [Enterobacter kobei]
MHSLKNLPPLYPRPTPLKGVRWLYSLFFITFLCIIITRMFGRHIKDYDFWFFAVGIPFTCWFVIGSIYVIVRMLKNIKADGYDKRRKMWILSETQKSRRAFHVLSVSLITGHRVKDKDELLNLLIANKSIISAQRDRTGNEGVRLSLLPGYDNNENISEMISDIFSQLICQLPLKYISCNSCISVLLDVSSVISAENINAMWHESWREFGGLHSYELLEKKGPVILEDWLNTKTKENSLLLVVALQIAPIHAANSAETAVALLLGNRLMQGTINPIAILHRPDPSPTEELESGMRMAAYNVPIKDGVIKHLWLSGLNDQQHAEVVINQNKSPAHAVENDTVINLDSAMGCAGAAAPWLAIAAASETAQQTQLPQMIISGDTTQDVLWSTLVTPTFFRQEMDL